jgi:hypothetical protein
MAPRFTSEDMGRDAQGYRVSRSNDGGFVMDFRLTECHGASATGSWDEVRDQPRTACRSCYQTIDSAIGGEPVPPYTRAGAVVFPGPAAAGWEVFHR